MVLDPKYDWNTASKRLEDCFAAQIHLGYFVANTLPREFDKRGRWIDQGRTYDIVDIHNALVNFDERKCVEKYPKEGPGSDEVRNVIDKRRADIEKELEEAEADPDGRRRYSWVVAQRRVRDCFAGNFAEDQWPILLRGYRKKPYNITEIYKEFILCDWEREKADAERAALEKEYAEAKTTVEENAEHTLHKYSFFEVEERVCRCFFPSVSFDEVIDANLIPFETHASGVQMFSNDYDIFDIHKAVFQFDKKILLQKYPEEGPGSEELKKVIDEHRQKLEEEYLKATSDTESQPVLHEYLPSEAERRVRDCFAGASLGDVDIFSNVKKYENDQSYDIFDIKEAIDHFDKRTFLDAFKDPKGRSKYGGSKQKVDEQRASIQREYEEATSRTEIEHGSGFIVHDHFIITNRHVIETYLYEKESHEICISNEAIGELACKVIHYDAGKDLALLYCPDLNLKQSGICPLHLSSHSLLPGMSIFSFGYPMSHTGETALFVSGNVSGFKETLAGHSMVVLNCSLNSGNSGGPVMCWVKGQLRVVGVATQKHFKDILTLEERETVEHIRKSLQIHAIPDVPERVGKGYSFTDYYAVTCNHQTPMSLLTLKLYDALETHSQFNLSNALQGHLVVDFIKDSVSKYTGEYKEELAEIIKLSEDRVNILPSGHLSPSQCCIQ